MVQVKKVAYMHEKQEVPLDVTEKNLFLALKELGNTDMEAVYKKASEMDKAEREGKVPTPTTTTSTTASH